MERNSIGEKLRNIEPQEKSLYRVMAQHLDVIDKIVDSCPSPKVTLKPNGSPVTDLDLLLSSQIEEIMRINFPQTTFYSEEKFNKLKFPLLAVDPLDGTKEYIAGRDDWAISIGLFPTNKFCGDGWIYNPKKRECFFQVKETTFGEKESFTGEVSRTEWESGFFKALNNPRFNVVPMGSIAYKLGRLSHGESDFVVSLRPKNIWDIAGGTFLCQKAGIHFFSQGSRVREVRQVYEPPLIWCREELFPEISQIFSWKGKYL